MWLRADKPLVILAPMDGYTTPPFRRFVKYLEPRARVFSEFLPARAVASKPKLALELFKVYQDEKPVVIQLYGKDPEDFRIAALLAEEQGAGGVDINMGCPAKKVVAHRHGSALMKEIDLACAIIDTLKRALKIPVTVKTRLGWEDHRNLIPFVHRLADVGLDGITIHGRTYSQKFEGEADWGPIYALKDSVSIPVFGNGDITRAEHVLEKIGNLDGVMIGRGAVADPWLVPAAVNAIHLGELHGGDPGLDVRMAGWRRFAAMSVEHAGSGSERYACRAFRKYLVRLHRSLNGGQELRRMATSVDSLRDINHVLDQFLIVGTSFSRAG